jgi:uncharacterized phiE125 gp8 family phage protein
MWRVRPDPYLVTPPAELPVTLEEMKHHLYVSGDYDDALIASQIAAAVGHLDGWNGVLGRALMPQEWELALSQFPSAGIYLPVGPFVSVVSVIYTPPSGPDVTVDPQEYNAVKDAVEATIYPVGAWPKSSGAAGSVRVRWSAGTGAPEAVKQAIKLMVGQYYRDREDAGSGAMNAIPGGVFALTEQYRRRLV